MITSRYTLFPEHFSHLFFFCLQILRVLEKLCTNQELFKELPPCQPAKPSQSNEKISVPQNSEADSGTSLLDMLKAADADSANSGLFQGVQNNGKSAFSFLNAPFASGSGQSESVNDSSSKDAKSSSSTGSSQKETETETNNDGSSLQELRDAADAAQVAPQSEEDPSKVIEGSSETAADSVQVASTSKPSKTENNSRQISAFDFLNSPPNI